MGGKTMKKLKIKIIIFISDLYYVVLGDRSTMYQHKVSLGIKPSWRDYARNPIVGIFGKYL